MKRPNRLYTATTIAIFAFAAMLSAVVAQAADVPVPNVSVPKQTYVIGRDKEIPISGRLPAECAGTTVKATLYTRGPAAAVNPIDDVVAPNAIVVAPDGSLDGSLPLPTQIRPSLATDALGISGDCVARTVFYLEGPIYLAIPDKGPGGSFVIPASVLSSRTNIAGGLTIGEDILTLTATVDSTKCATIDLVKGAALDADGNARITVGAAGQPEACSRDGATVTFTNGKGQPSLRQGHSCSAWPSRSRILHRNPPRRVALRRPARHRSEVASLLTQAPDGPPRCSAHCS